MDVRNVMLHTTRERVRNLDHLARVARLDEMPGTKVAVAKVESELDPRRHRCADAYHPLNDVVLGRVDERKHVLRLPVPDDHLVAEVPLDAEVVVRNCPTYRLDLAQHGLLVGRFD